MQAVDLREYLGCLGPLKLWRGWADWAGYIEGGQVVLHRPPKQTQCVVRTAERRKQLAEISVTSPKLPNISGPVIRKRSRDTAKTTRRSDRHAPTIPNSATNSMTVGISTDSRRKVNLPSGIPIRPLGHGRSNRSARPVKFHITQGSTSLGKV